MAGPKVTNRLPQFVAERQRLAARGMTQALVLGASEASVLTPVDTSTLLNSQYRDVRKEGDAIVGTVGYTAAYALAVHESKKPVTFRRATAEREFLRKGFENAEPNIRAVITGAIKA
jgi:hypothetical protein